jgi:nicotinamide-nucleotide adenylyltransferase
MENLTPEIVSTECGKGLRDLIIEHLPPEVLARINSAGLQTQLAEEIAASINNARHRLTGFYIGRFQPFHNGHLLTIQKALEECDELIIGLGSPYKSHSERHPFTAEERMEMVRLALEEADISRDQYQIVPIPDINRPNLWAKHVTSITPRFGSVYSGSAYVAQLFKEEGGFKVNQLPLLEEGDEPVSATRIRKAMIEGKGWEHMVSDAVAAVIKKIGGEERLRAILDN